MRRLGSIGILGSIFVGLLLQGCTTLRSVELGASAGREGVLYMLPKALLPVQLVANGGVVRVDVLAPVVVGDTRYRYVLSQPAQPFRSDNVIVEVDPRTALLKSVKVTANDKSGDIIKKIFATLAKPESALAGTDVLIYRGLLDPSNERQVRSESAAMQAALATFLDRRLEQCRSQSQARDAEACEELKLAGKMGAGLDIRIDAPPRQADDQASGSSSDPGCGDGIFYRPTQPFTVSADLLGAHSATVVYLPNDAPAMSISLCSLALVTTTHDVVLVDGTLSKITSDKPSSALALVSLPLDVARAVIGTVSEFIQFKVDLSGKEKALAEAKVAEINALAALQKALAAQAPTEGAESGHPGGTSKRGVLLSAQVGRGPTILPPTPPIGPAVGANAGPIRPGSDGSEPSNVPGVRP